MQTVITNFDLCGSLIAAIVLFTAFRAVTRRDSHSADAAWWVAGACFVIIVVWGALSVWPPQSLQLIVVLEVGVIAGSLAGLIGAVLVPPMLIAFEDRRRQISEWNEEIDRENQLTIQEFQREQAHRHAMETLEANRKYELELRQAEALRPKPTREELEATIRKKYEDRLRLLDTAKLNDDERYSAHERAKQIYLRELDELLK